MPVIKRIRKRGSTITVEAHAEVLFAPGAQLDRWMASLVRRININTTAFAPSNKRPRWSHYGPALKKTIRSAGNKRRISGRDTMAVYGAVGSTAPYSLFVDQGTGVYGGNGPYEAKLLPPWTVGDPSLYEKSWHPPGKTANHRVMIKGQKGQFFFDRGLEAAFSDMRLVRRFGGAKVKKMPQYILTTLEDDIMKGTPVDEPFKAQRAEWRRWRDERYRAAGLIGRNGGSTSTEARRRKTRADRHAARREFKKAYNVMIRRQKAAERARRWRDEQRKLGNQQVSQAQIRQKQRQQAERSSKMEMMRFYTKNPKVSPAGWNTEGFWYIDPGGTRHFVPWSIRVADLWVELGVSHKPPPKHT